MKTQKQHHHDKLQKTSILFMQLGLVLALLIVYVTLESYSAKNIISQSKFKPDEPIANINNISDIIIERTKKTIEEPQKVKRKLTTTIKTMPNDTPTDTFLIKNDPTDKDSPSIGDIIEVIPTEDDVPINIVLLEQAPIFPGCEGLNREESKLCFTKKIAQFVNKKFNTNLASEYNLSGKQKIFVQFIINKKGEVTNIKTKAPHVSLEKEAERVINQLPQMEPGKQHLKPVKVRYTLPIVFEIH